MVGERAGWQEIVQSGDRVGDGARRTGEQNAVR